MLPPQSPADSDVVEFARMPVTLRVPRQFTCARDDARDGAARVQLTGELDLATAARLERALREAQADASQVVLDLHRLTFMDCSGMHVIVDAAQRARRAGHQLTVVPGPAHVERVFTLTGTADIVETAAVTC